MPGRGRGRGDAAPCYGVEMGSTYLDTSVSKLKEFEGSVEWMYLDTVGKVTVGVGLMLPDAAAAEALGFLAGDRTATPEEIAAEFARVSGLTKGKLAKFYLQRGGLRLTQELIESKLRDTLAGFEGYLRNNIRQYDTLPDAAKVALLDMIYNLGPGKLFAEYPRLIAAVDARDWKLAAQHSARRGPPPARNDWTRQQFLAAAREADVALQAVAVSPVLTFALSVLTALAFTLLALELYERSELRARR